MISEWIKLRANSVTPSRVTKRKNLFSGIVTRYTRPVITVISADFGAGRAPAFRPRVDETKEETK